jgi:hypothetical protein
VPRGALKQRNHGFFAALAAGGFCIRRKPSLSPSRRKGKQLALDYGGEQEYNMKRNRQTRLGWSPTDLPVNNSMDSNDE